MAITYGFFNSINGDRKYNAEHLSDYFKGLISDGIYESIGERFEVHPYLGQMSIAVGKGRALIDRKWMENDADYTLEISQSHAVLNRYTAIVIQLNYENREINIVAKDGENASTAVKPTIVNNESIKELCLAYIYVKAGVTSLNAADITDMRGSSLCPWVTGIIEQVDTSDLFDQWQEAYSDSYSQMKNWQDQQKTAYETWIKQQQTSFESWLATLTEELQVNTHIKEYKNVVYTTEEDTAELEIGIDAYDSLNDILYANINGVMFVENEDYTIEGTGAEAKIIFNNPINADNAVEFRVLKSTIGNPLTAAEEVTF